MNKKFEKNSVEKTLLIPLWCRALACKKLPSILPDKDAIRILDEMGLKKPPNPLYHMQVASLSGAIRQYNLSCAIKNYLKTHPKACVIEMGAGLSCLRRQMKNDTNNWINIDLNNVIQLREKYIPLGEKEKNYVCNLTKDSWFEKIPFNEENGAIFLAAGVLHYLKYGEVKNLLINMSKNFPGAAFAFDIATPKGALNALAQVKITGNKTKLKFFIKNARKELSKWSSNIINVSQQSYYDAYPVKNVKYNFITKWYIKSKKDKLYFVICEFKK